MKILNIRMLLKITYSEVKNTTHARHAVIGKNKEMFLLEPQYSIEMRLLVPVKTITS